MWTRKDLKEFKDSLRKDKDSVIKVGSGETVTVRLSHVKVLLVIRAVIEIRIS